MGWLSFSLIVSCQTVFAQQKQADSLRKILAAHQQKDTTYVGLLNKLSFAYATVDNNTGMRYADEAVSMAKTFKASHLLGEAYMMQGRNYDYRSQPKNALSAYLLGLGQFERSGSKKDIINGCIRVCVSYYNTADYITALEYGNKALALSLQTGDQRSTAISYNAIGSCYMLLADYPRAGSYFYKELRIAEKLLDKLMIAKTTGNLGLVNYYQKKYAESLKYNDRCLVALGQLHDTLWMAAALNNIGGVYLETKDYPKAIAYNQRALDINRRVKSKKGEANDLMDMGVAYGHLNNYPTAFECLDRAVSLYDSIGAKNNSAIALGHLADLYQSAPDNVLLARKVAPASRLDKALAIQLKAVELAQQVHSLNNAADQFKKLSELYEKRHNYQEALASYRQYSRLNDSVFNDKKRTELTRLGIQFDYDKKEAVLKAENQKKQAELSRQKVIKNASIIVGLLLLLLGAITFIFYNRRKDAREKQKEAELKAQVSETEMKALRAQLNPHFIFNSLNSIGDYMARYDKETADIYLGRFAKLMRMILENSEQENISLADDLKALELYIQLEALRLGQKLLYHIEIDKDIDPELTLVPPMLLQPFVENSIWHGISPKNGSGSIHIRVKMNAGMVEYTVEDDGIGRLRSAELKKNRVKPGRRSFGIKVTQSRIDMINAAKKSDATVELTDLEEGTKVSIKLPLDLKF